MSEGTKDNFANGIFWELYQDLERQFQSFLEYTPYLPGNETVYSFKLLNLLLSMHACVKTVYVYRDKKRVGVNRKAVWVWPNIQSTTAWEIVRKVLGDGYYPHFLRLNRLTEIGDSPGASLTRIKSVSGIKSVRSIQAYMGTSRKAQKEAFDYLQKRYSKT